MHVFTIEDRKAVKEYCASIKTLSYEYKPTFLEFWGKGEGMELEVGQQGLYIFNQYRNAFIFPYTSKPAEALLELEEIAERNKLPLRLECVPESYLGYLEGWTLTEDRNSEEYIYLAEHLTNLTGKKLQAKRNHINQFRKAYPDYLYSALSEEDFASCWELWEKWYQSMAIEGRPAYERERLAIQACFASWKDYDFRGGKITVGGKLVAFSVGEKISDEEAIIHFEKADTSYIGSYPAINQFLISSSFQDVKYINRQEDTGSEGLRKAKLSYHPDHLTSIWTAEK